MLLPQKRASADEERIGESYYEAFVIALVLCLSPFKGLAYFAPLLAGAWFLIASKSPFARRRCIQAVALASFLIGISWLLRSHFNFEGAVLAIVTYSTFLFLLVIPVKSIRNGSLRGRMMRLIGAAMIVEAGFGIVQALVEAHRSGGFDMSNGDAVEGTISFRFKSDAAFGNPMFGANVCFMLIALLPYVLRRKRSMYTPFILGAIVFVLASIVHMIIFVATAFAFAVIFFGPPFPIRVGKWRLVVTISLIPLLTVVLLASNVASTSIWVTMFLGGELPKAVVIQRALFEMPQEYPEMPYVGLGPGQFSSRASLIATGLYFAGDEGPKTVPLLHPVVSPPVADYLADLWATAADQETYGRSSTARPYFSWMSVYSEFGAPALLAVFVYALILIRRMKVKARSPDQKWLAVSAATGIVFLILLGFQENYWEVPQAILVGLMLIQVTYANIVYPYPVRAQNTARLPVVES
jgi:hypothetical protein